LKKGLLTAAKLFFFLGIGVFFIWIFMRNISPEDKKEIFYTFFHADYYWILVSMVIGLLSHVSRTMRWMILMEPLGYKPRFKNAFFGLMVGYLANLALPRLGEVTRCGVLTRYEKIPMQKSFGTVVTERAIDMISLLIVFILNLIINLDKFAKFKETSIAKNAIEKYHNLQHPGRLYIVTGLVIVALIVLFIKFRHKISHYKFYKSIKSIIIGFIEGLKSLTKIKKPFWFFFHSVFIWFMYLLMAWVVFFSLPETGNLGLNVALAVLAFGSIGIIVVQGGIGIYPWIVAEILVIFYIPQTKGYAMGWLLWTGQTLMIIVSGLISMIILPLINSKKNGDALNPETENIK
jgi:uncharacterized protein (TIRG00374 family)